MTTTTTEENLGATTTVSPVETVLTTGTPGGRFSYNAEQLAAIEAILRYLKTSPKEFFLLSGSAGTGKTACMREVNSRLPGHERPIFTAPTNKATKVLRQSLPVDAVCMTTYKLLGLRMEANGEVKEIAVNGSKTPPIAKANAVVVDEGSMANRVLYDRMKQAAVDYKVPVVFMGDPAQLPPVKEISSPIWTEITMSAHLSKVMRHDNQILTLATLIRAQVNRPFPQFTMQTDADVNGGVIKLGRPQFEQELRAAAKRGEFASGKAKAIAWRNAIVNKMNVLIRHEMQGETPLPYAAGDRIIALSPCTVGSGESQETLLHTDAEATVKSVTERWHPKHNHLRIMELLCDDEDDLPVRLLAIHPSAQKVLTAELKTLVDSKNWRKFWALKEAFHEIRHAYAITAHRSQGSTYESTYVDYSDILHNPNKSEATRCLYVACTRSTKNLYLTGG